MSDHHVDAGWVDEFERALASSEPTECLRAVVADLISAGADRELVHRQLELLRVELQNQGRDVEDDVVLDVLDFLTGWCSPHQRIE